MFTARLTSLERREEIVLMRDDLALVERLAPHSHQVRSEDAVHLDYLGDYLDLPLLDEDDVWTSGPRSTRRRPTILLGFLDELGVPPGDDEAAPA